MKTLYFSDLDGTFLNSEGEISENSRRIINEQISDGLLFSISTARTQATVLEIFKGIDLNVPMSLMNGVVIFDPVKKKILKSFNIDTSDSKKVLDIFISHGKEPMFYYEDGDKIKISFSDLFNSNQLSYISSRKNKAQKTFVYTTEPKIFEDEKLIYIVTLDPYEELKDIYEEICRETDLNVMFYPDNYTHCYFLEISSKKASKGKGALYVKEYMKCDKIISFGDNLNDIPLFEVSDECYCVSNGADKLKAISNKIIGSNDEDSVPRFIEEKRKKEEKLYGQTL